MTAEQFRAVVAACIIACSGVFIFEAIYKGHNDHGVKIATENLVDEVAAFRIGYNHKQEKK